MPDADEYDRMVREASLNDAVAAVSNGPWFGWRLCEIRQNRRALFRKPESWTKTLRNAAAADQGRRAPGTR